jgi:hypothetical protein
MSKNRNNEDLSVNPLDTKSTYAGDYPINRFSGQGHGVDKSRATASSGASIPVRKANKPLIDEQVPEPTPKSGHSAGRKKNHSGVDAYVSKPKDTAFKATELEDRDWPTPIKVSVLAPKNKGPKFTTKASEKVHQKWTKKYL